MPFVPKFSITVRMASNLMRIERANTLVDHLPLPATILKDLQKESRVQTVLLSTKIEGNRLSEAQKRAALYARSRSAAEQEVANLLKAMEYLEECEERGLPVTEELIKRLHAIIRVIPSGRRPRLSEYRQVQNAVRDEADGRIVYMPPEWQDVPRLMEDLVAWVNHPLTHELPVPIQAGVFLYQFLTIHPYLDGNGRTGRALATYLMRRGGLGLKRLFVLETYYDRNLAAYYENLQMGLHHNYYFGRHEADLTGWLEFFLQGVAEVFAEAARIVESKSQEFLAVEPDLLRGLDGVQRAVFAHLALRNDMATTTDLRRLTGLADRTIRDRIKKWIHEGFLTPADPHAKRIRTVKLACRYEKLAQQVRTDAERYKYLLR
ncbi:MAG TPA: Fic family protein [Firmicutes bacterium]|nr:Fic family protein [Bacillota bacterium]